MAKRKSAWISREWFDTTADAKPKRRRAKVPPGTRERDVGRNDRFVVEWIDPAGKRCRELIELPGPRGLVSARSRAEDINAAIRNGSYQVAPAGVPSWGEGLAKYLLCLESKRDRTQAGARASLERFEKLARPTTLASVSEWMIESFAANRQKGEDAVRASTVNKDLRVLKAFLRKCRKWKLISVVPEIEMLDEEPLDKPHYTAAEMAAMFNAADIATLPALPGVPAGVWWRALLAVLWDTGMRIGETISVEWRHVDFANRTIHIPAASRKSKKPFMATFGEGFTEPALRKLQECAGGIGPVFTWKHDSSHLNAILEKIQEKAGIDTTRRELKFHAIRRAVGEYVTENYGVEFAQQKLGHSTSAITKRHYASKATARMSAKAKMPIPAGVADLRVFYPAVAVAN